ncbi:MAG: DNA helicase UvrD [Candidatus Kerfeldbacteria bacterium]|nr:DNA helicase UvrD [Candidatus Kerfeldbacteria bacterium]
MRTYADLHIHSKYARACSPQLTPENIDLWGRIKGVGLIATGDFTHPKWFEELKEKLEPAEPGLYRLKKQYHRTDPRFKPQQEVDVRFIFGTEVACIYKHKDAVRRVHHCLYLPSLESVAKFNAQLIARGRNLKADGRPILGLSSQDLLKILLAVDERGVLIPAHAWTPWFAIFGSKSGYDSIAECFDDLSRHIFAIETGLSSDPPMNWRLSQLDDVALVSHSDAHSLPNLGREVDIFAGEGLSYEAVMQAIRCGSPRAVAAGEDKKLSLKLAGTVEFFPDEGRYHYDGHRDCKVRLEPGATAKHKGICPTCGRELTIGVLNRVYELADRVEGVRPKGALPFVSLIELDKVIAQAQGVKGRTTKAVEAEYWGLVSQGGGELQTLLDTAETDLSQVTTERVVEAIRRLRQGLVASIEPGYDGVYGSINLFSAEEKPAKRQTSLF